MSQIVSSAERITALAVRLCYGVTAVGVVWLFWEAARDTAGDGLSEGQRARDQYAGNPGFNPEEKRRNRERAEKATNGNYP